MPVDTFANPVRTLRLGTRGSTLARMQSQLVANALEKGHPGLRIEVRVFKTTGDQVQDRPLHELGGKGLFTKELELALLAREVDFVVHSYKDVPVTMPLVDQAELIMAATPEREDPRDVLATRTGARRLADLPANALVGTGSLRRICQLLHARPDVRPQSIRGNIDTRLRKLAEGQYDAVILALAGTKRAAMFDPDWMTPLETPEMLPAPAQGCLALQCRRDDAGTRAFLKLLHHRPTEMCIAVERELVQKLNGDCHSPIGALATIDGQKMTLKAAVGARHGRPPVIFAQASGLASDGAALAARVYEALAGQDVETLLRG
jgi:hydroxymethylbilane synthase